jgi:YD repeat-containing protein
MPRVGRPNRDRPGGTTSLVTPAGLWPSRSTRRRRRRSQPSFARSDGHTNDSRPIAACTWTHGTGSAPGARACSSRRRAPRHGYSPRTRSSSRWRRCREGPPANGQPRKRTDRRGVVTDYAYDAASRPPSKTFSDGTPGVTSTTRRSAWSVDGHQGSTPPMGRSDRRWPGRARWRRNVQRLDRRGFHGFGPGEPQPAARKPAFW